MLVSENIFRFTNCICSRKTCSRRAISGGVSEQCKIVEVLGPGSVPLEVHTQITRRNLF
jgi:hypothetical protein